MGIYFFDYLTNGQVAADPEGQILESLSEAREVACLSLCQIAGERLGRGSEVVNDEIIVCDSERHELARVRTSDAIRPMFRTMEYYGDSGAYGTPVHS